MTHTISRTRYRILDAIDIGHRTTAEIRWALGHDPHPVLGRIRDKGWAVFKKERWELTQLGKAALDLGHAERRSRR